MAEVTELKPSKPGESGDSGADNEPDQTTSAPKPGRGRPPNAARRPPEVRQPIFFDRVASVPKEDWGTRAFMYVYVDEPACNPKTFGESRYLLKSSAPILDLEGLKQDYGSFKGWMSLNLRKSGKDATDEVDRLNFEIYDPKHPPKIPRGSWANDARNKRWLDLLPPEPPPASAAASSLLEGARFYKDMRQELKEEIAPAEPQQTRTSEVLETMKAAKELFAPVSPAKDATPPADPFDLAAKIMAMRSNDPMMAVMMELLKNANTANEAARQREYELLKEKTAAPVEKPKTFMEQMTEFKTLKELFTTVSSSETVRAGRTGALDVVRDLGSKFFESDLANGVGQWLGSLAQRNASGQPVQMNGAPPQNGASRPALDDFQAFIQNVLNPALLRHYLQEFSGTDFAGWLYDGYPDRLKQLQAFTHPMMPGLRGAPAIIQAYKRTESMWPALSSRGEDAFAQFVKEFCEWKPEPAVDAEVIEAQPVGDSEEEGPERI